ncbi:MAG: glycine cleavage T C-terminal barrel domain-containing protein, partial [Alphaproteobacteria bacterium]|nr:glycine cleavage T C-terminal barrel domain-containing protein [Alphaproteobacteria bacterium]
LFGARALNSLRLEKGYGSWAREYRPIYTPAETGLDRFVAADKNADFVGRAAFTDEPKNGAARKLCLFKVDASDADAIGDEAIWLNGDAVGWVTSGGYAHHSQASIAMGYVPAETADAAEGWQVEILGDRRPAKLLPEPLFDPQSSRLRG